MLKDQLGIFAGGDDHSLLDDEGNVNIEAVGREPRPEDFNNEYAAPGEDALLPVGIQYTADWKIYADGIANHAREQVLALASTGLPVGLHHFGTRMVLTEELHPDVMKVAYLEDIGFTRTLISIKHLIIHSVEMLRYAVCPVAGTLAGEAVDQVYRSTIVYTSLERDYVGPEIADLLNKLGQVWVPCVANVNALVNSGVEPSKIKLVPYPFDPSTCTRSAPRGPSTVPSGKRFYHIGKWEPRKNQHRILGAFLQAYGPQDRASLMLKTSPFGGGWVNYPSPEESLAFWLNHADVKAKGWDEKSMDRLVRIISEKIPEEELMSLHTKNNIYVSAAAGEAWEIPAFDAKLCGNRLVHAGYGGTEEYAEDEDVQVPFTMTDAHPGYAWEDAAQWADVKTKDIMEGMLQAEPPERRVMPNKYVKRFGRAAVGVIMEAHITELAEQLGCIDEMESVGGFG